MCGCTSSNNKKVTAPKPNNVKAVKKVGSYIVPKPIQTSIKPKYGYG